MSGKIKSFKMEPAGVISAQKARKESPVVIANMRSDEYPAVKTSGIKMRGGGAATKGTTCRGPMA